MLHVLSKLEYIYIYKNIKLSNTINILWLLRKLFLISDLMLESSEVLHERLHTILNKSIFNSVAFCTKQIVIVLAFLA